MSADRRVTAPPFERIAAELRQRITTGRLVAGDRVPSTRALARTWKVAPATAAHALGALAKEGAIRSIPRVGNVVAGVATARSFEGDLTALRAAKAGVAICDEAGLDALSIRAVAARLGVAPMSLYRHVRSKDELVALMTDVALGEEPLPVLGARSGWRARLEASARFEWRAFKRHPWVARVISVTRPEPTPNALAFAEWVLGALEGLVTNGAEKMRLHIVLHGFVQGLGANLYTEVEAARATGMTEEDWMRTREARFAELAASGRLPMFARALDDMQDGFDADFDRLFELGLRAMLDGFEAKYAHGRPRR